MKRFLILIVCVAMLLTLSVSASATSNDGTVIFHEETLTDDGLIVIDEVILYNQYARATNRTAERRRSFYDGDTLIAVIAFTATFRYHGSSVSVVSKSVTQTDTYESWSYKQNSFTSSGGTVTLSGKLTKWLIFNNSFTMGLVCDVNGNVSIT